MSVEMKSSDLIATLQISSINKEAFKRYLSDIYDYISSPISKARKIKSLDLIAFHDFLNFPMLVSEKIFQAFESESALEHNGEINKKCFIKGMEALFCIPSIDSFTNLIFNMADFNSSGLVMIYNIKILLIQLHLRNANANNKDTSILKEILSNCLGKDFSMSITFDCFRSKIAENADVIFLFLAFIFKYFNKEKESVEYYSKVIWKTMKAYNDSFTTENEDEAKANQAPQYVYAAPTQQLLQYLKELGINIDQTQQCNGSDLDETVCDDDLTQLDDFESEIQSCMLVQSIESPYRELMKCMGSSEMKFKSMNMSPLMILDKADKCNVNNNSSNSNNNNNNINTVQQEKKISKHHSSSAWGLSSLSLLGNKYYNTCVSNNNKNKNNSNTSNSLNAFSLLPSSKTKEFICSSYTNNSNEKIKVKMIFISNTLFTFKYSDQYNSYTYTGLNFLRKNYIEKTQEILNEQFSLTLTADYGGHVKVDKLFFEDKAQCELFYEEYIRVIQYRNIKDEVLILNEINSGNCGSIYTGFSNKLNKKVCIKKISKRDKEIAELKLIRWEKDVTQLLIKLNHKNIMEAYDIYEDESNVYLILEYIDGVSLLSYSFTNEEDKSKIAREVIEGLRFLHKNSIVHRDIKHDNIMIMKSNTSHTVKIVDFGFARVLSKYDTAEEYCGSISFTAPEILLNNPYGYSADVWSIGVLIFWIQYKLLPFRSTTDDIKKVSRRIVQGVIYDRFNGGFGDKLILMCLKSNPIQRTTLRNLLKSFDN